MRTKKAISVLLLICMLMSMLPLSAVSVFADDSMEPEASSGSKVKITFTATCPICADDTTCADATIFTLDKDVKIEAANLATGNTVDFGDPRNKTVFAEKLNDHINTKHSELLPTLMTITGWKIVKEGKTDTEFKFAETKINKEILKNYGNKTESAAGSNPYDLYTLNINAVISDVATYTVKYQDFFGNQLVKDGTHYFESYVSGHQLITTTADSLLTVEQGYDYAWYVVDKETGNVTDTVVANGAAVTSDLTLRAKYKADSTVFVDSWNGKKAWIGYYEDGTKGAYSYNVFANLSPVYTDSLKSLSAVVTTADGQTYNATSWIPAGTTWGLFQLIINEGKYDGINLVGATAYVTADIDGQKHYIQTEAFEAPALTATFNYDNDDTEGNEASVEFKGTRNAYIKAPTGLKTFAHKQLTAWVDADEKEYTVDAEGYLVDVEGKKVMLTADGLELEAKYTEITHNITWLDGYNNFITSTATLETTYVPGDTITTPKANTFAEHYGAELIGWQVNGGEIQNIDSNTGVLEIDTETAGLTGDLVISAVWADRVYKVTYYNEVGTSIIAENKLVVNAVLADAEPAVPAKEGYTGEWGYYQHLEVSGGVLMKYGPYTDKQMPSYDLVALPVYEANAYTIHYVVNGKEVIADTATYGATPVVYRQPADVAALLTGENAIDTMFEVIPENWNSVDYTLDPMPARDVYLYASTTPVKYGVTFYTQKIASDGVTYGPIEQFSNHVFNYTIDDMPLNMPVPTIEGYEFKEWRVAGADTAVSVPALNGKTVKELVQALAVTDEDGTVTDMTKNALDEHFLNVIAVFAPKSYNVNYYIVDKTGTPAIADSVPYAYGATVDTTSIPEAVNTALANAIANATDKNYTAKTWLWTTDVTSGMPAHDVNVYCFLVPDDGNYTVYFLFEEVNNDLHTLTDGRTYVGAFDASTRFIIPNITEKEFKSIDFGSIKFEGFEYAKDADNNDKLIYQGNELDVYFKRSIYTVTYEDANGTTTKQHKYGAPIELPAAADVAAKPGYTFVGWTVPEGMTMPAKDITVKAIYEMNTYDLNYIDYDPEKGELTNANHTLVNIVETHIDGNMGTAAYPSAKPGYTFTGWTVFNGSYETGFVAVETIAAGSNAILDAARLAKYAPYMTADGNLFIAANYTKNSYNLTLYYMDGFNWTSVSTTLGYKDTVGTTAAAVFANFTINGTTVTNDLLTTLANHTCRGFVTVNDVKNGMPAHDVTIVAAYYGESTIAYHALLVDTSTTDNKVVEDRIISFENFNDTNSAYTPTYPTLPTIEGYTAQSGWKTSDTAPVTYASLTDFTGISSACGDDFHLYTVYTLNSHTISWVVDENTTTDTVYFGKNVTKPTDPTKRGHTFTGWKFEYNGITTTDLVTMPDYDVTATAQFTPNTYTIRFVYDKQTNYDQVEGSKKNGYAYEIDYTYGVSIAAAVNALPAPTRDGYDFVGWDWDNDGDVDAKDTTEYNKFANGTGLPANGYEFKNVYAVWKIHTHTVTYNLYYIDYAKNPVMQLIGTKVDTYDFEAAITDVDYTTITGYDVTAIYANTELYTVLDWTSPAKMGDADIVLNAVLYPKNTVNYTVEIYTENVDDTDYTLYDAVIFPAVPSMQVTFSNYYKLEGFTFDRFETVPETIDSTSETIKAYYKRNSYKITYTLSGDITEYGQATAPVSPKIQHVVTYKYGATVAPLAKINQPGFTFDGWYGEPATMPASNVDVPGTITLNTYKVFYDFGLNLGSNDEYQHNGAFTAPVGNPDTFTVLDGMKTLADPSCEGLTFVGWVEVDESNAYKVDNYDVYYAELAGTATKFKTVNFSDVDKLGNRYFLAVWQYNTYTVTFHNGRDTLTQSNVKHNTWFNLKPDDGRTFEKPYFTLVGWSTDPYAKSVNYFTNTWAYNLDGDFDGLVDLYAVWSANETLSIPVVVPVVGQNNNSNITIGTNTVYGTGIFETKTESQYNPIVSDVYMPAHTPSINVNPIEDEAEEKTETKETNDSRVDLKETSAVGNWNNPFTDVSANSSYYNAVRYVYINGIFKGLSATEFGSEVAMTRGMYVTVLGRLLNIDVTADAKSKFKDVSASDWYAAYVSWAADSGIVLGYGDNTFGPNDPITREQMMVIMYRFAQFCGFETGNLDNVKLNYMDKANISDWAIDAVKYCKKNNLTDVVVLGNINPTREAKRYEVAEIIYKFMEYVVE